MLNVECFSFQQVRPVKRRQEIPFHFGKIFSSDGITRDQHQFDRLGKVMLVQPETFAQQPPRPAARHRAANLAARYDAQLRRRAFRQSIPVGDETAQREPLSLLPHAGKIALLPEPGRPAQPQASGTRCLASGVWGRGGHELAIKRASGACGPRGGGCATWRGRSWWICGQEIRAAVCAGFLTVDTGVS